MTPWEPKLSVCGSEYNTGRAAHALQPRSQEDVRALWELRGGGSSEPPPTEPPLPAAAGSPAAWKQEVAGGVARGDVTMAPAGKGGGEGGANRAWGAAAQSPGSPGLEGGLRAAGWLCPASGPERASLGPSRCDQAQRSLSKERVRRGAGGREEHDIAEVRSPEGPGAGLGPAPAAFGQPRPGGGAPDGLRSPARGQGTGGVPPAKLLALPGPGSGPTSLPPLGSPFISCLPEFRLPQPRGCPSGRGQVEPPREPRPPAARLGAAFLTHCLMRIASW